MERSPAPALSRALGGAWQARPLGASGFCSTWRADGAGTSAFVKTLPLAGADTLEAEADGLAALAATRTVRVPAVLGCWRDEDAGVALLALEWLDLRSAAEAATGSGARLGEALGALHAAAPACGGGRFGWHRDNRLGATPQDNRWSAGSGVSDWIGFLADRRLGAMRRRLAAAGAPAALCDAVDAVCERLPAYFADGHRPRASLVHGDLWSGNQGVLPDGTPVIYDPSVSCSDAEAELAMMELFGSWPRGFAEAYRAAAGLHEGYAGRRRLCQLYHLLNHALLFGGSYVAQSAALAQHLARGP